MITLKKSAMNYRDSDGKMKDVGALIGGVSDISSEQIAQIDKNKSDINGLLETINGNGEGSIDRKITNKISEIVADAPESFDTLKEMSDWITEHSESAADMNSRITSNTNSIAGILQTVYPVGSVYMSALNTEPSVLFGFGTWEQIKDTFLLACGNTYAAGETGGEATHKLTIEEMPEHTHGLKTDINSPEFNVEWPEWSEYVTGWSQASTVTNSPATQTTKSGYGDAHNNMPPYLAVYVWKRIA